MKDKIQRQCGQSAVEFALAALLVVPLTSLMADFGRAAYTATVVQAAAQDGARAAMVDAQNGPINAANVQAAINTRLSNQVLMNPTQVTNLLIQGPDANNVVQVSFGYNLSVLTPGAAVILGSNTVQLNRSASLIVR